MKSRSAARMRIAVALLLGFAVGMGLWFVLTIDHIDRDTAAFGKAYNQGYSDGYTAALPVYENKTSAKSGYMPLFLQKDPQWADAAYSDETIGTYGCGLTAAAMALSYLNGREVTPDLLAAFVGESCLTDRVNDMAKFSTYLAKTYHFETRNTFWGTGEALKAVDDGWIVFAGVTGTLGERSYGSHVVMIWRENADGTYALRDPDDGTNSIHAWTTDELNAVSFTQFNAIKR